MEPISIFVMEVTSTKNLENLGREGTAIKDFPEINMEIVEKKVSSWEEIVELLAKEKPRGITHEVGDIIQTSGAKLDIKTQLLYALLNKVFFDKG